ncbi:MAG: cation/acetate symporter [Stygiobacter sp.]|nr:MAG: cation/acetate symporter [Stygiobacter sp.]
MFGQDKSTKSFTSQLAKVYGFYTGGFITVVILLAIAEQMGLSRVWIGYIFLFLTVALYAGIGIMSRTNDADEYYVAGRRVPAVFNGMATGADWMSAASFIGMAGTLYLSGYSGLAFIMGWSALPAQVRPVHHPRLPGRPLWRSCAPLRRHRHRHSVLLHLRCGADLRCRSDHHPPVGC